MKRIAMILMLGLLTAVVYGQTTTVTATAADTDGTAWANGSCSAMYAQVPQSPGQLTNSYTGAPLSPNPTSCTLDGSGHFSITLVQTRYVYGPATTFGNSPGVVFTVCPAVAPKSCYATAPIVITGTTQSVTTQINAVIVAPRIVGNLPWSVAYNDTEVAAVTNNCYKRLSDLTLRSYNGAAWVAGCGGTTYTLPTQYQTWACQPGLGDGTNAIAAATYPQTVCRNESGATWTITGIRCFTDNAGTSTMDVTDNSSNDLLTGPITCSSSWAAGTQSATVTIPAGGWAVFSFIADGTSKQATFDLHGTY